MGKVSQMMQCLKYLIFLVAWTAVLFLSWVEMEVRSLNPFDQSVDQT